jgi:nicotinate dehydrogenase subunit B
MLGGILAGTPNAAPPAASGGYGATWIYNLIPNVLIESRGAPYFGAGAPNNVGLRMNIMRSPGDYQSVFGQESIMNEAAAAAGVDPIQMRLNSLSDPRGITVLNTVRTASGWDNRPSPNPASTTTKGLLTGRGIALTKRAVDGNAVAGPTTGTWAAAVAELTVNPKTGKVVVTKMTVAYDAGFVVNPTAIYHTIESGILQQTSMTVLEEVAFNHSTVTSTDWVTYPILRIKDSPDINIVLVGSTTSAPVNAAGEPIANPIAAAISGAFYDATGKFARKLPLRSENVKAILAS